MVSDRTNKMRGRKTRGYGAKKEHRGKGSAGGKGWGGSSKHNRSYVYAYEPEHFGKRGFTSLHKRNVIVNVGDLEKIGGTDINLTENGVDKLLGKGEIKKAVKVTVVFCSASAKEKIEKAGGTVTVSSETKK
ncbi:MAG: uL15 family ribosomal protein [Candidatus Aenigmarchaeota archaeon]|nr:uL15 family ribosomal protein [Candidatus Aenigmarchaeota archaeon]